MRAGFGQDQLERRAVRLCFRSVLAAGGLGSARVRDGDVDGVGRGAFGDDREAIVHPGQTRRASIVHRSSFRLHSLPFAKTVIPAGNHRVANLSFRILLQFSIFVNRLWVILVKERPRMVVRDAKPVTRLVGSS